MSEKITIAISGVWLRYNRDRIEVMVCVDDDKWVEVISADVGELIEDSIDFFATGKGMQEKREKFGKFSE